MRGSSDVSRWLRSCALVAWVALTSCSESAPSLEVRYLHDRSFRRRELEASFGVEARKTSYGSLRLARYGGRWEALPELVLPTSPVALSDLDSGGAPTASPTPLTISREARAGDVAALRALGEQAFFRYPMQFTSDVDIAIRSRDAASKYGFWFDEAHGVGGIVRARLPDGSWAFAWTCATCHASSRNGALIPGAANERLRLGELLADAAAESLREGAEGSSRSGGEVPLAVRAWGAGRIDVSMANTGELPVQIPDLRPVRFAVSLHHAATIDVRSVVSLAIRIETLIIAASGESSRPPREVALGLAEYLWSLAPDFGPPPPPPAFRRTCMRCHGGPGYAGRAVSARLVGTDPRITLSPDRGTGKYRTPSLRFVSTRGALMHDGSIKGLDALLDPHRTGGHLFGTDLAEKDRREILAFLETL